MTIRISLIGASGRMGSLTAGIIESESDLELHSSLGSGSGLDESLGSDLLVEFTRPDVSEKIVDFAIENNLKLIVGSSGWSKEKLDVLAQKVDKSQATIVVIPNFSIGSVLASKFAADAAKYFDSVQITETHDIKKLDAPSGTALFTSKLISESRNGMASKENPDDSPVFNGIPIRSIRIEGVHAEQEVLLEQPGESLFVRHSVTNHEVYGKGVLLAIRKTMGLSGLTVGLMQLLEES